MSPTARSLQHLRKQGALAQVVERYNPHAKRRIDLFGFIDIIALLDMGTSVVPQWVQTLGIQTTTTGHISHRLEKLRTECADAMRWWLMAGNRLEIHGWAKRGARGKRKTWTLTERVVTVEDL
jgi:hypothetical protein